MNKTICTYFEPIPELNPQDEIALIRLWEASWQAHGWETRVLHEYHAMSHPHYERYSKTVKEFPSVNPGKYDYHCFIRWLALSASSRGNLCVMSDYDVMSYGWQPTECDMSVLGLYQKNVPALVSGHRWAVDQLIEKFMFYQVKASDTVSDRPHISDMYALQQIIGEFPDMFHREQQVLLYTEDGWEQALAVHYSNSTMQPNGKLPRYEWIPKLRPIGPRGAS